MGIYKPKHFKNHNFIKNLINSQPQSKLAIPEIYPNTKLPNSNTPIASDENVNRARKWIEINKL